MKHGLGQVEAFMEVGSEGVGVTGPISYRAGYRWVETGEIICAIELPASIVEPTIFAFSNLETLTTPDGHIVSTVKGFEGGDSNRTQAIVAEPIDAFIARSLSSENLRMEEATLTDLVMLLRRLDHSVSVVREAIGRLENLVPRANPG
jgi:hypothetical protein